MNKYLSNSVVFFVLLFLAVQMSTVLATSTTNTDSNPGQVKTASAGDTLYLTTQVTGSSSSPTTVQSSKKPSTAEVLRNERISNVITGIQRPIGFADNIGQYLTSVLSLVMVVSLLLVFFYFILAGFQWITSGGDKGKTEEARNKIINAFVGILIVSSSFAVAGFVGYILGFDSLNDALSSINQINPS